MCYRIILLFLAWMLSAAVLQGQTVDFGPVQVGSSKDSNAVVTNPLPFAVVVSKSTIKHSPSDFSITAGGAPFTIPPGGSHAVGMRFTPSVVGLRTDSLVLEGAFPGSPLFVALLGTGIPLPVELISFSAKPEKYGILLEWITASETQNFGFEVHRRSGAAVPGEGDFAVLGFVPGNGNSVERRSYWYLDTAPPRRENERIEYRIKQIDWDGGSSLSPVITLDADRSSPDVKEIEIYPHPVGGFCRVRIRLAAGNRVRRISVRDCIGRTVLSGLAGVEAASFILRSDFLPRAGVYILEAETDRGLRACAFLHVR